MSNHMALLCKVRIAAAASSGGRKAWKWVPCFSCSRMELSPFLLPSPFLLAVSGASSSPTRTSFLFLFPELWWLGQVSLLFPFVPLSVKDGLSIHQMQQMRVWGPPAACSSVCDTVSGTVEIHKRSGGAIMKLGEGRIIFFFGWTG